ncbi:hypothetical protein D3C71_1083920 [compost metagenome]
MSRACVHRRGRMYRGACHGQAVLVDDSRQGVEIDEAHRMAGIVWAEVERLADAHHGFDYILAQLMEGEFAVAG